jgi:hypothetical protein
MTTVVTTCPECEQELELAGCEPGMDYECPSCSAPVRVPGARPKPARSVTTTGCFKQRCAHHPGSAAIRRCEICGNLLCSACLVNRYVDHVKVEMCPCGGRAHRLTPAERGLQPVSFEATLGTAFGYPFKGQGGVMLVLGTLFLSVVSLLFKIPILGWAFLGLTAAYIVAFLTKIIWSTALGGDEAPEWPEMARMWTNIFKPFVLVGIAAGLTGGPAAAWYYFHPSVDGVFLLLAVGGAAFFPMGLACTALTGSPVGLNPILWLATMVKVPGEYFLACFVFFMAAALKAAGEALASQIPYAGPVVGTFLLLYFLMVEMRILGLTFQANRVKIGWF